MGLGFDVQTEVIETGERGPSFELRTTRYLQRPPEDGGVELVSYTYGFPDVYEGTALQVSASLWSHPLRAFYGAKLFESVADVVAWLNSVINTDRDTKVRLKVWDQG